MTTTQPKLLLMHRRGSEAELTAPLPSALAKQVRERADQHRKVAATLKANREQVVALARELAQRERQADEQAAKAVAEGRSPSRTTKGKLASLRDQLAEAEHEVSVGENALRLSAAGLFTAALPHVGDAIAKAQAEHERALARAHDLAAAMDTALADADAAEDERLWLAEVAAGQPVEPYRARTGRGDIARLRQALGGLLAEFDYHRAEREAERERVEAVEREGADERRRGEQQAAREAEAGRMVTADRTVESIGGKAVRRGAFGPVLVDDEEGGE
jgi:seryl-tRNA synthetase